MSRRLRFRIAGISHHVIQRGTNRCDIFSRDEDYEMFLLLLANAMGRHPTLLHGYALLHNHFHLQMTPEQPDALERVMKSVGERYVSYFNRHHGRTGTLFQGRYRATVIDSDVYWFRCMRYVEMNPVRARLVSRPEAYAWSSYSANAFGAPDNLLTPHPLYLALADSPEERQAQWRRICAIPDDASMLAEVGAALHRGGVVGRRAVRGPASEQLGT